MLKSIKKGVGVASKGAVNYVGKKLKDEAEEKINLYRNKVESILWKQIFLILGFVLIVTGVVQFFSETYRKDLVFILIGAIILLLGLFFKKRNNRM